MSEVPPEALAPDEPDEAPDPEEYEPAGDRAAVSPDTGTVYEGEGEAAVTPYDDVPTDDDE
jgi:hypothetical protein